MALYEADAANHSLRLAEPEHPTPEPVPAAEPCGLDRHALKEPLDVSCEKAADPACSVGGGAGPGRECGPRSAPDFAATREEVVNEMVEMARKMLIDDWKMECEQAEQKLKATACGSMLPTEWNTDQQTITREDQLKKALPKEAAAEKKPSARGRGKGRKGRGKAVAVVSDSETSDEDDQGGEDLESNEDNLPSGSNGDTGGMDAFWNPEDVETKPKRTRQPKKDDAADTAGPCDSDSADGLPRSKRAKRTRPAVKTAAKRKALPKADGETEKTSKVDVESLTPEQLAKRAKMSRKSAAYHKARALAMKRGLCEKAACAAGKKAWGEAKVG